jgi:integrative and conjugative element protein (TIGR02256 family)
MANFWMPRSILAEIEKLASLSYPMETGGMLLGYVSDNGDVVVTAIIGPGPAAKHSRYAFEPDADYQQAELEAHYSTTEGRESYLGDWHTHPHGPCIPSRTDKRTLAHIALTPSSRIQHPIMAIAGYSTGRCILGAVRFQSIKHRMILFAEYNVEVLNLILY